MITGLDHVTVLARDHVGAVAAYETLLGVAPAWRWDGEGVVGAFFETANTGLEILAPAGEGAMRSRLDAHLAAYGEGLASLAFAVDDLDRAIRRAAQVGLEPAEIAPGLLHDRFSALERRWRRTRLADAACAGLKTFLLERQGGRAVPPPPAPDALGGVDHVVIRTAAPERALAHYGARLGLSLRMDRTNPSWGARLLFFRVGDLVVEIAHPLAGNEPGAADSLWGLTWRARDLDAAHTRLSAAGLALSEVRPGRKPGTRVFTVRSGALGVPTLVLSSMEDI